MEKVRAYIAVIITLGFLALVFQAVGFFAPAWMSYDMDIHAEGQAITIEVDMGLWATTGCVDTGSLEGKQCRAFSNEELRSAVKGSASSHQGSNAAQVAGLNFLDDFTKVKVLATLGGLLSIAGFFFSFVHCKVESSKTWGVISALAWGLGAILIFSAVGFQAQQNVNVEHGIDLIEAMPEVSSKLQVKTHVPWAIIMSAFGAFFNVVVALIISIYLCYTHDADAVGTWKRFGNQAI